MPHHQELLAEARTVLERCRRSDFIAPRPTAEYVSSLSTTVVALTGADSDPVGAGLALRRLFDHQWSNGMLPHAAASSTENGAFASWGTDRSRAAPHPRTSGIAALPLHASATLAVAGRMTRERRREFLAGIWPRLVAWHQYLHRDRDPDGTGVIAVRHPWERAAHPEPPAAPPPGSAAADLANEHAASGYDESRIRREARYLLEEAAFNAVVVQADRDMGEVAGILGYNPRPFEAWAQLSADAVNRELWDAATSGFIDRDLSSIPPSSAPAAATSPLFAAIPDRRRSGVLAPGGGPPAGTPILLAWLQYRGLLRYDLDDTASAWRLAILDAAAPGFPTAIGQRNEPSRDPSAATAAIIVALVAGE